MVTNNQNIGIVCPVPMGEWQASVMYEKLNIVKYNGTTYIAKKKNSNVQPETTSGWAEVWMGIADKGETGDIGLYHTMSPSSATVAISSLQPQETTPIVGSAVLFPNGDMRQITGVGGSAATLGNVLFSVKGDPGIGNATLSNTDGDSTTDGFTQAAVKGAAQAKNYENQGFYDSSVYNSDGTKTVTRKTGYLYLNGSENWQDWRTNWGSSALLYIDPIPAVISTADANGVISAKTNYLSIANENTVWGNVNAVNIISFTKRDTGVNKITVHIAGVTSGATAKEYFSKNPCVIQYKLLEQYEFTDQVIKNQPIHTLNQEGEQWLREEWRKGLNLFDASLFSATERRLSLLNLKVGEVYTISPPAGHSIKIAPWWNAGDDWGGCMPTINGGAVDGVAPFYTFVYNTTNEGEGWKIFIDAGEKQGGEDLSTYQIMLVEGSHPYPYKPYYGGIVREKDLSGIQLFPVYVNPAQTIGGDWLDLGTVTVGSTTLHTYQKVNGGQ